MILYFAHHNIKYVTFALTPSHIDQTLQLSWSKCLSSHVVGHFACVRACSAMSYGSIRFHTIFHELGNFSVVFKLILFVMPFENINWRLKLHTIRNDNCCQHLVCLCKIRSVLAVAVATNEKHSAQGIYRTLKIAWKKNNRIMKVAVICICHRMRHGIKE